MPADHFDHPNIVDDPGLRRMMNQGHDPECQRCNGRGWFTARVQCEGNAERVRCGECAPDLTTLRDALANAMCRHSLIGDWFEKADLVIADLLEVHDRQDTTDA